MDVRAPWPALLPAWSSLLRSQLTNIGRRSDIPHPVRASYRQGVADRRGSDDDISRLLSLPVWAVVGLTANRQRPSYGVARFLLDRGVRVIPVNPEGTAVHDQPGVRALSDIDQPVDVVDIFRRSAQAGAHVDEAIAIGAAAVWLQLGVVDSAAADRAESAGLTVVMDRCPAIEWPRLGPNDCT